MKPWLKWVFAISIATVYVACSPKKFSKDENFNPCQNSGQNCVTQDGKDHFNYSETVEGGKVDILVVTDNSASMSYEQARLADRFNGFIANLESKNINYRIGVITTDVSAGNNAARPINNNGGLQDGRLIPFPANVGKYLSKDSGTLSQKDTWFKQTVKRPETLACEQFILGYSGDRNSNDYSTKYYANCPSGDERGIFALNLAVDAGAEGMIRPEADLAVIVLSDEDVRSGLYYGSTASSYPLDPRDSSDGFVSLMKTKYPNKTYAVHSINVISNPKDTACLAQQNSQTGGLVSGSYGVEYEWLRHKTGGVQGNICASDYTAQLLGIYNNIQAKIVDKIALACGNPEGLTISLTNNSDPSITWTVVGTEVKFSTKLPVGTTVNVQYSCPTL